MKTFLPLALALLASSSGLACLAGCGALPAGATAAATGAMTASAAHKPAAWLEGAVVYAAVPPFVSADRPLAATTARLPGLAAQGVDAVWLSPVYATDDLSGISYAVTDYTALRPDFGTDADFDALVAKAHGLGMKVLLDFVPNHTSSGHPYFQDAEKNGKQSPYWGWYVRDAAGKPQHYFDWGNLMNLDYDAPAVQAHVTGAFMRWADRGVDGFRVDAAWGVKDRTPTYWPKAIKALRAKHPDLFMLAEASARDPYYVKSGFDAAYDWTPELGHWAWEKVWDQPARAGERLHAALGGTETPPDRVARFLNNNDTGTRFVTKYGVARQRVAAVLLHTLPGIPMVYMGDEVGAEFEPYEDPAPLTWKDPHGLKLLYKRLAELRGALPALRKGAWTPVKTPKAPGVYAFVRKAGAQDWAVVVLNFGKAATVDLALDLPATGLTDALTGKPAAQTSWSLKLAAESAQILVPKLK